MTDDYRFGFCPKCGYPLEPVCFIEEEYKITKDGFRYKTGRTRYAVSHLECENCLSRQCVDDSFDGPWR